MDAFNTLKKFIFLEKASTESSHFKLHYRLTFMILFAASVMNTGRQYFGDPINCLHDKQLSHKVIEAYCWAESTYSVTPESNSTQLYVGVSKHVEGTNTKQYHSYYQWVWLVLFIQAFCFYLPHLFWKYFEAGRTEKMVEEIRGFRFDSDIDDKIKGVATVFVKNITKCSRNLVVVYLFCEFLNLFNIIGQWYLLDKFLNCNFISVGFNLAQYWYGGTSQNPMTRIFPRLAKCAFSDYGPSGDIQKYDILCVLTINILNEKVYTFLWFWFMLVTLVTIVGFGLVVTKLLVINRFSPLLRHYLKSFTAYTDDDYPIIMCKLNTSLSSSDYFFLDMLTRNLSGANKLTFVRHVYACIPTYNTCFELNSKPSSPNNFIY